jgi:hypothetical protein
MLDPLVYQGETFNDISSSSPCNHGRNSLGDNGDDDGDDAIDCAAAAVVDPLPSSFVITSPVRQAESSQGTVSPIQSPVEAMERYQREQQREPSKQEISRMQQQSLAFPQKKRSSRLSSCSTSAKPRFQKHKRRPKMAQTTLSFHGGGSGK